MVMRTGGNRDIISRYFANLADKTSPKCQKIKRILLLFIFRLTGKVCRRNNKVGGMQATCEARHLQSRACRPTAVCRRNNKGWMLDNGMLAFQLDNSCPQFAERNGVFLQE